MMPPVPRQPIYRSCDGSISDSALCESFVRTFGHLTHRAPRSVAEADAKWTAYALQQVRGGR